MARYLFSWVALQNDFAGDASLTEGPNYNFHRYHYNHDAHVLLTTPDTIKHAQILISGLRAKFPEHMIQMRSVQVPINQLPEVKSAVERVLMEYAGHKLDIFFSPGSSIMQVAWYLCHTTLNLDTRLLQLMRPEHSKDTHYPELHEIAIVDAPHKSGLMLHQYSLKHKGIPDDYFKAGVQEEAFSQAELVAQTDGITTVIYGESGTGKELIAREIYRKSIRHTKPFRTINCSAMSDQLLESRLFGYKRGAFTGAAKDSAGLFKEADQGTVFLDEIGDISPYMQQVMLRVLQEGEIQPLGGRTKKVDTRVIAATNRDLYDMCTQGQFRWDLYYRLAVVEIYMPPVAQFSASDKRRMMDYFSAQKSRELRKAYQLRLSADVKRRLMAYPFPGNLREAENLFAALYVLNKKDIGTDDLPRRLNIRNKGNLSLDAVIRNHTAYVVAQTNGNKSQAARILGVSANTLKKYLRTENNNT